MHENDYISVKIFVEDLKENRPFVGRIILKCTLDLDVGV
jgi:hypothetical protein